MMELGIDDEEELETNHDATTKKVKPTPGEKGEGGQEMVRKLLDQIVKPRKTNQSQKKHHLNHNKDYLVWFMHLIKVN